MGLHRRSPRAVRRRPRAPDPPPQRRRGHERGQAPARPVVPSPTAQSGAPSPVRQEPAWRPFAVGPARVRQDLHRPRCGRRTWRILLQRRSPRGSRHVGRPQRAEHRVNLRRGSRARPLRSVLRRVRCPGSQAQPAGARRLVHARRGEPAVGRDGRRHHPQRGGLPPRGHQSARRLPFPRWAAAAGGAILRRR